MYEDVVAARDVSVNGNDFEKLIAESIGIKGLVNQVKKRMLVEAFRTVKSSFGFEILFNSPSDLISISEYFNKVCNVHLIKKSKENDVPVSLIRLFKVTKNTYCFISWNLNNRDSNGNGTNGYIYIFGKKSYRYYHQLNSVLKVDSPDSTVVYSIYSYGKDQGWSGTRKINPGRSFDTLYLGDNIEQKIKSHLDSFLKNKEAYTSRGITFKTGILLYGSPGTGKSSIAAAIANYLNCDMVMIDSGTFRYLNINEVTGSINADREMYVIVLDDIDVILTSRDDNKATTDDKATLAKLLGFLDSSNSPDNVVFVATTNHIELFDEALTRSGRFDQILEVKNITPDIALDMCKGFGLSKEASNEILEGEGGLINPAKLQAKIVNKIKNNQVN